MVFRERVRNLVGQAGAPVLFWAAGVLLMFYPTLLSGFERVVGSPGDPRLLTYLLEHTFRWVAGMPGHASLWDPPFFFPMENVFAFSDALLGIAPLYWLWRLVGIEADSAYQACQISTTTLTYISAFVLFRRGFGRAAVAAAAGALLFAFGAPRIVQVLHVALLAHFYTPVAILALLRVFQSDRREPGWTVVLVVCVVLQLYSGFYLAWLLGFALLIALGLGVVRPADRAAIRRALARNGSVLLVCALLAGMLLIPLVRHYVEAARVVGFRDWATEVAPRVPVPQSWIYVGPQSLAYFWLMNTGFFRPALAPEGSLGIGFVATGVAVAGLVWGRRDRAVALVGLTAAVLIVLATSWPPGWSLWRLVHAGVPGAAALREVARVGLLVLLALSLGFATAVERLRQRSARAAILAIGIPILEQLQYVPSFSKRETVQRAIAIAARVPPRCPSFYYAAIAPDSVRPLPYRPWKYHLHAMDAQLRAGVPTVNGYSGWAPPRWQPLYDNIIRDSGDTARVRQRLEQWAPREPAPCIVTGAAEEGDLAAAQSADRAR
jgi:hypothetical protein